jgi:hypothetical protein
MIPKAQKKAIFFTVIVVLIVVVIFFIIDKDHFQHDKNANYDNQPETAISKITDNSGIDSQGRKYIIINKKRYANKFGKNLFSVKLVGRDQNNSLRLMWLVRGWPKNTEGFVIKRKANGNWQQLSSGVIFPEINLNRDWKAMGMNAQQEQSYRQMLSELHQQKKIKFVEKSKFIKFLGKYGIRAGDRIKITKNNNLAFFMGLAAIDNSPIKGAKYGLFTVDANNTVSNVPVGVYINSPLTIAEQKVVNPLVYTSNHKVILSWKIAKKTYDSAGMTGFNIYKRVNTPEKWVPIGPSYSIKSDKDFSFFNYIDSTNNGSQKCEYAVAAKNYFQDIYAKTILPFDPVQNGPVSKPLITSINVEGQDVTVNWTLKPEDLHKIKGYYVRQGDYILFPVKSTVINKLFKTKMSLVDKREKHFGGILNYQIVIETISGQKLFSAQKSIPSPGKRPLLPAPTNFKAKVVKESGKYKILFSWDKVKGANKYLFFSTGLFDKILRQNGTKSGTAFKIDYPVGTSTRVMNFGIAALPVAGGPAGSKALIKDLILGPPIPQDPENFSFERNAGRIIISWSCSDKSVTGFEVYVNDKLVKKLKGSAREYVIDSAIPKNGKKAGIVSVKIVSVNPLGRSSGTGTGVWYTVVDEESRNLPVPKNFQVQEIVKDKQRYIKLTWDALDVKKNNLRGYCIKRVYTVQGLHGYTDLVTDSAKYKKNEYLYKIPNKFKSGMTFSLYVCRLHTKPKWKTLNGPWVKKSVTLK